VTSSFAVFEAVIDMGKINQRIG